MWINFKINIQNIEAETDKAILVKIPKNASYGEFCFWVSKKCVREGAHSYEVVIGLNNDKPITIKRTGKNFKVLDQKELPAEKIAEQFEGRA